MYISANLSLFHYKIMIIKISHYLLNYLIIYNYIIFIIMVQMEIKKTGLHTRFLYFPSLDFKISLYLVPLDLRFNQQSEYSLDLKTGSYQSLLMVSYNYIIFYLVNAFDFSGNFFCSFFSINIIYLTT